jgi:hypothetical protein
MRSVETAFAWPEEHAMTVRGDGLTAVVHPSRGAKIVSLVDDAGREWLAQPESAVGAPARPGADFLAAEMAGWDECAPTIVACEVEDAVLPDHGSLWTADFTVDGAHLRAIDDTLGFIFDRWIAPSPGGLRIDYAVLATRRAVPFLWAAHPQFLAPPGTHVRVPGDVRSCVDVLDPSLPEREWAPPLGAIDSVPDGGCRKVYIHPDTRASEAHLVRPDGTLRLRWSEECPYLGLWFDRGMYRAGPVIAIEPSTSYFDALTTAIAEERTPTLSPVDPLRWSVWLEVGEG